MITRSTQRLHFLQSNVKQFWLVVPKFLLIGLLVGLTSCNATKTAGPSQRIRLQVGEIKEVSLANRGDGSLQLIGTSDNQEVVEVSRPELAPAVDTLQRNQSKPTIFQLKGVTVGTANVVFSEKQPSDTGNGQVKKTYVVQVVSK
jgi:hypothetical protein